MGLITQWSYSRWKCYDDCPAKAKYKFVDKLPEPGSPAMDRGTAIHKMAEDFVNTPIPKSRRKGVDDPFPSELKYFEDELRLARRSHPIAEQEWAFTVDWEPTTWFAKDAWCRVKTDLIYKPKDKPRVIVDHKTGKVRDEHQMQLGLYGLSGFIKFPDEDVLEGHIWYIDHGTFTSSTFERPDVRFLKDEWNDRVRPMLNDTVFPPKPSYACRWCHFRKDNGGPCQF